MTEYIAELDVLSIALVIGLALVLIAVPLLLDAGAVTAIFWPTFGIAQILIGHAILDQVFEGELWPAYAASAAALVAGYYLVSRPYRRGSVVPPRLIRIEPDVWRAFSVCVIAFVVYHFAVGGIPLLSDNVEEGRFDFSGSGLFGIPGRMFLFGLPFLVAYASYAHLQVPSRNTRELVWVSWTAYVAAMVLSGFKGSLVVVIGHWVLIRSMAGIPLDLRRVKLRYIAVCVLAVLFGSFVASRYQTLDEEVSVGGTAGYLFARTTVIAAAPGALAVRELADDKNLYTLDDFYYFTNKYFHVQLTDREVFPLDKVVSSQLTGTPLEEDEFVVAVTVGAFPGFVVDFGVTVSVVLMLAVGCLFGFVRKQAERSVSPWEFGTYALVLRMLATFIVNGGLAYSVINCAAMLVLLRLMHVACEVISRPREAP